MNVLCLFILICLCCFMRCKFQVKLSFFFGKVFISVDCRHFFFTVHTRSAVIRHVPVHSFSRLFIEILRKLSNKKKLLFFTISHRREAKGKEKSKKLNFYSRACCFLSYFYYLNRASKDTGH